MTEKWLTKKMRKEFRTIALRSFESCRIASVPDLHAIVLETGAQFWIEAKLSRNTTTFEFDWSSGQEQWIKDFEGDNGQVFIVIMNIHKRQLLLRSLWQEFGIIDLVNPLWANVLENLLTSSHRVP
jgi:hypothetical protein